MQSYLKDFLRSGALGEICVGLGLNAKLAILSDPEAVAHNRLAYKYQGVQIHFLHYRVTSIVLYSR